ncbi:RDD family protein [Pontibacter ramchanderi]|uniref:Putative RDD family membrane protein YckC n=1 Tax=Pontibacter ramchanderi TaxID=1179743 RepID=A0A2N3U930_9BACT|nr:RDD family protein [Pontibacter ramchanderi]PKV63247.1 putative RDD family membrane protein YckC [Pontibacter ramchanderi]
MPLSYQKAKPRLLEAQLNVRVLAFCLDTLLLLSIIGVIEYFTFSSNEEALVFKSERLLHLLMGWLYFAGTESATWQGSIGKHLLGLRVVSHTGERISFRCASLRYLLKPVSVFVLLLQALAGASPTSYSRLFHDRICKTRVLA